VASARSTPQGGSAAASGTRRRTLAEALGARPLLFEPVPPSARTPDERVAAYVQRVVSLLREHPRVDAFVVPELVSENHHGEPHYRSGDVTRFAAQVSQESGCEAILNKVVAHVHSTAELEGWCRAAISRGTRNMMFIGGTSRYIPYPGPSVAAANAALLPFIRAHAGVIGNVLIPHREHEGYRMLTKTRSGASFFTTQIVFGAEPVAELIHEYGRLCGAYDVTPSAVLLSVAPVADEDDLEFVRWLGAEIPPRMEGNLVSEDGSASIESAVATWREVVRATAARGVAVPLGLNVEVVSPRHFGVAVKMLTAFEAEIDYRGDGA
jgi:5,10-methylenetetrahydrofolate reductase